MKGTEEVRAAACRCVALDDSGQMPANRALGLFETDEVDRVDTPRTTTAMVTSASVEFMARPSQRKKGGGGDSTTTSATGTVRINMLLEVDDEYSALLLSSGTAAAAARDFGPGGELAPTKEDVEMAASAATGVVADNPAEAPVAISAIAAWNLATTQSVLNRGAGAAGAAMEVRIEVAAAFGYHGDWYTTSKNVTLVGDGYGSNSGGGGSVVSLSTSFDWEPTGDVWSNLDEPAVADVKVYSSVPSVVHSGFPVAEAAVVSKSVVNQEEELVLLQATLCKRSTSVGGGSRGGRGRTTVTGAAPAAPATIQATLMPYTERKEYDRPQQPTSGDGGTPLVTAGSAAPVPAPAAVTQAAAAFPSQPVLVVSEIEDGEWWKAHEEKAYSRGVDAINALPRLRGWKPGDWKKRRKRRIKQDEERERRRSEEAAHRRADRRGGNSGFRRSSGRDSSDGARSAWGTVKGAWRVVGRMWRRSVGMFRRRIT